MHQRVFIAIGSNQGHRVENCRAAIWLIDRGKKTFVVKKSHFYETEPWGNIDQPTFINSVIEVRTELSARELLGFLKSLERKMGRSPSVVLGPRIIDLDIIFYGNAAIREKGLEIPHPGAHERAFVLLPLNEIAPEFIHPALNRKISELAASLKDKGGIKKLDRI